MQALRMRGIPQVVKCCLLYHLSSLLSSHRISSLFAAIGCPDPTAHTNAWVRRMGETLVAKCNNTDETWYLTCHNTEWIGEIGNCTERTSEIRDGKGGCSVILTVAVLGVWERGRGERSEGEYSKKRKKRQRSYNQETKQATTAGAVEGSDKQRINERNNRCKASLPLKISFQHINHTSHLLIAHVYAGDR